MALFTPCLRFCKNFRNKKQIIIIYNFLEKATYSESLSPQKCNVLETVTEDLSGIIPSFPNTFNLAAYVNKSDTLKSLVDLNVNLSKIEKKPHIVEKFLKLDLERDIKHYIIFFNDYMGLEEIGKLITKNPMILCEPLQDIEVRINYLESKGFKNDQVKRIITANPFWLMLSTLRIDRRLGYFQNNLSLCGNEVRYLSTKQPKLITYSLQHVRTNMFVIKEEMGFDDEELKNMVLKKPKLLMLNQRHLLHRFNYIHNTMKIQHKTILEQPEILLSRNFRVKQRHLFLEKLGRAQYDPTKENYIPIKSLVENSDTEFCRQYAKCSVNDFNVFLKTQ